MANFNYVWQGGAMPFPSSGVSTQVQFGPQAGSQLPLPQAQLNRAHSSVQQCVQPAQSSMTINHGAMNPGNDFYLKVLCPENKKEYKTVTLRGLSPEGIDTPTKLKEAISGQCDGLDPENLEVGYYSHSTKLWINSRLDINHVWSSISRGEKLTLWCLDTTPRLPPKRKRDNAQTGNGDDSQGQASKRPRSSQGLSTVEKRKAKAKEYEQKLVELHKDKWTSFQYKLWAEMLVCGTHTSLDEPPSASMFSRESKRSSSTASSSLNDTVVSGMMTMMSSLCQALVPKPAGSTCGSPVKRAELRGTYIKQLAELKQLRDSGILDEGEYEEQRSDIIELMRQLNQK